MRKISGVAAFGMALAVGFLAADTADAMRRGGDNAVSQQRAKLQAEWAQARRAGGYGNPLSALADLLNSRDTAGQIQPVINDPPREVIWDRAD
ncbi:MAG: hypothetical protein AAF317_11800 [Pseudomonadota bacterium]